MDVYLKASLSSTSVTVCHLVNLGVGSSIQNPAMLFAGSAAPDWMASRNRVTLSEPDTWLGGYSLNVATVPLFARREPSASTAYRPTSRHTSLIHPGSAPTGLAAGWSPEETLVKSSLPVKRLPSMVLKLSFQALYRTAIR